jgi:vacuolar-type H+-ATPase subunit I/STV1
MAFFKKYNGTNDLRLLRIERWTWILIYGGLLVCVLSYFMPVTPDGNLSLLSACGLLAVVAGAALIVVRSRLHGE